MVALSNELEYLKHVAADILVGDECDGGCGDVFEEDQLIYIAIYDAENDEYEVLCHECCTEEYGDPVKKTFELQKKRRENGLNSGEKQ